MNILINKKFRKKFYQDLIEKYKKNFFNNSKSINKQSFNRTTKEFM